MFLYAFFKFSLRSPYPEKQDRKNPIGTHPAEHFARWNDGSGQGRCYTVGSAHITDRDHVVRHRIQQFSFMFPLCRSLYHNIVAGSFLLYISLTALSKNYCCESVPLRQKHCLWSGGEVKWKPYQRKAWNSCVIFHSSRYMKAGFYIDLTDVKNGFQHERFRDIVCSYAAKYGIK